MSNHYDNISNAIAKTEFGNTMVTLIHTGSIQDQMLLKWLVSQKLSHILVYGVEEKPGHDSDDEYIKRQAHLILFDNMELKYRATNDDDCDILANRIMTSIDNVTATSELNLIILTKPMSRLVKALHSAECKSDIARTMVIGSNVDITDLEQTMPLYLVNATAPLDDVTQKIMEGMPEKMPLDPLFFIYAVLWLAGAPTILGDIDIMSEKHGACERCTITPKNMESATTALSYFILSCFS
jgi:hypothetical protein